MTWDTLAAGRNCPFDHPREEPNDFWESVAQLKVSTLCLMKNQAYRGHCILIYDTRHATSPEQLSQEEWADFSLDAHRAVSALRETSVIFAAVLGALFLGEVATWRRYAAAATVMLGVIVVSAAR